MKFAFAILVLACHACISEATLKHLKAKLKLPPFAPAPETYRYVVSPVVLREQVPVVYSSPVSLTSTYSTVPHYAVYKSSTYSLPIVYGSTVAVPVPIYEKPLAIYEEPPVIHYGESPEVSLEATGFDTEGHYSAYGKVWDK